MSSKEQPSDDDVDPLSHAPSWMGKRLKRGVDQTSRIMASSPNFRIHPNVLPPGDPRRNNQVDDQEED